MTGKSRHREPHATRASLVEFDDVAGRYAAGSTVEKIAIDDGAKFRGRQRVVSAHQILDFKSAVFGNGFERGEHVRDPATFRKRQQHPLIGDYSTVDVVDVGNRVHG